jgi:membrane protein EpsK
MTFWGLVNNAGSILIIRTGAIIANIGLGSEAAGYFNALYSVSIMLRSLATAFSNILFPKFMQLFAIEQFEKLKDELLQSLKLQAVVVGFLVGIISGLAAPLLQVWLGKDFARFSSYLILMISFLILDLSNLPLISIHVTFNKVKIPSIINFLVGVFRVVLAVVFISRTSLGLWGLIVSEGLVVLVKNICFIIPYNQSVTGIPILETIKSLSWGIIGYAIIFIFSRLTFKFLPFENLISCILVSFVLGAGYFFFVLRVIFKKKSLLLFLKELKR